MLIPALRNTFLSLLLLTASRVKAGVITTSTAVVTLYGIGPIPENRNQKMISASAIGLDDSGGTVYVEEVIATHQQTGTLTASPTTTKIDTFTVTVTQASAWVYQVARIPGPITDSDTKGFNSGIFNGGGWNCSLEEGVNQGECIAEINWEELDDASHHITGFLDQTTTYIGQMIPMYTLTGPVQTPTTTRTSGAATIVGNPMFNKLSSIFLGMSIVVMLMLDF